VLVLLMAAQVLTATPTYADGAEPSALNNPTDAPANIYDDIQPGADDPRVKEGFAAYQAGDFKKAYDIWLPLAEAGNAEAQFRVGRLYHLGEGVQKNIQNAIHWYESAADADHSMASYNLGVTYDFGEDISKDDAKAFIFYTKAANLCHTSAQRNLGILYAITRTKKRWERDYAEAVKWLMVASMLGDKKANETISKLERFTTTTEQAEGEKRMQAWLESHACN
jgi:TPR repeat protein